MILLWKDTSAAVAPFWKGRGKYTRYFTALPRPWNNLCPLCPPPFKEQGAVPPSCTTAPASLGTEWTVVSVITAPSARRWMANLPQTRCARRIAPIRKWCELAITDWSRRVSFIFACCHSAKLCALASELSDRNVGLPVTITASCDHLQSLHKQISKETRKNVRHLSSANEVFQYNRNCLQPSTCIQVVIIRSKKRHIKNVPPNVN